MGVKNALKRGERVQVPLKALFMIAAAISIMVIMFGYVVERYVYSQEVSREEEVGVLLRGEDNSDDVAVTSQSVDELSVPFFMYPRTEAISYHIVQVLKQQYGNTQ